MRLAGSPSSTIQSIRQPSNTLNKDSLVFAYPLLIEDSLRNYSEIIRDFFTVQFITQIKISNALDIQLAASKANYVEVNDRSINPADELAKNLGVLSRDRNYYYDRESDRKTGYANIDRYEYQNKINHIRQFITDQIKHNPIYKDLNPIVSTVTIENLLDIPLILGTKKYNVPSAVLFWILFISAGYRFKLENNTLSLDNENSLKTIENVMGQLDVNDYMKYFGNDEATQLGYDDHQPSHRTHQLLNNTESELNRTLKYFKRVLNAQQWADESGVKTDLSLITNISASHQDHIVLKDKTINKSNVLFNGLISNHIAPLFSSCANALVSNDEADVSGIITLKLDQIQDKTEAHFKSLFDGLLSGTYEAKLKEGASTKDIQDEIKELQARIDKNSNICQIVPNIAIESILSDLQRTYFSLNGASYNQFAAFVEKLTTLSTQLNSQSNTLAGFINNLSAKDGNRVNSIL